MTSFSSVFMEAPGDCSPSRNVVSKMSILRVMPFLLSFRGPASRGAGKTDREHHSKTSGATSRWRH